MQNFSHDNEHFKVTYSDTKLWLKMNASQGCWLAVFSNHFEMNKETRYESMLYLLEIAFLDMPLKQPPRKLSN